MSESRLPTAAEMAPITAEMTEPRWRIPEDKLEKASAFLVEGRISHHPTRGEAFLVQGSEKEPYVTTKSGCTCKDAKRQSHCKHVTAVEILSRWESGAYAHQVMQGKVGEKNVGNGTSSKTAQDATNLSSDGNTSKEASSIENIDWQSIPATPVGTSLLPVLAPVEGEATALERSLQTWGARREVLTQFIRQHMVRGTDYGPIHFNKTCKNKYTCTDSYHFSKDNLFKPGSEKFLGLLQLQATFRKDEDTWEMLGRPPGILCYTCTLITRTGEIVGEGRGACDSKKDEGSINKAIKMAQKSAQIDAILRTGSLSDCFTQDLEDEEPKPPVVEKLDQGQARKRIVALLHEKGHESRDKAACEQIVKDLTGLALTPEHFGEIVRRLEYAKEA